MSAAAYIKREWAAGLAIVLALLALCAALPDAFGTTNPSSGQVIHVDNEDFVGPGWMITKDGGFALSFRNRTGAVSTKGTNLEVGTVDSNSVTALADGAYRPFGVMYSAGGAHNAKVWVVVAGRAQAMLEDGTSATVGDWMRVSPNDQGRIVSASLPDNSSIPILANRMRQMGYALETVDAGTDVLVMIGLVRN